MNTEIVRTASIVAAEINAIKQQTIQTVYYSSIEIGRRLLEAKTLVEHGDFGKWLGDNVDYSQSTANNLMKICLEFDDGQQDLFSKKSKSQTFGNLNYSQLIALLALPDSEREEFVEGNDVEDMSVRKLQKAIKERDEAIVEKARLGKENAAANILIGTLTDDKKAEKDNTKELSAKLNSEIDKLRKQLKEVDVANAKAAENPQKGRIIEDYEPDEDESAEDDNEEDGENEEKAVEELKEDVRIKEYTERVEALEREKAELEKKISASSSDTEFQKLLALFEMFQENYNKMYKLLENIATVQPEKAAKIKDAVKKVLESMSDKI